jgi:hypothetical protein
MQKPFMDDLSESLKRTDPNEKEQFIDPKKHM